MSEGMWKGRPIESYTKEELIQALREMSWYYESRISGLNDMLEPQV